MSLVRSVSSLKRFRIYVKFAVRGFSQGTSIGSISRLLEHSDASGLLCPISAHLAAWAADWLPTGSTYAILIYDPLVLSLNQARYGTWSVPDPACRARSRETTISTCNRPEMHM